MKYVLITISFAIAVLSIALCTIWAYEVDTSFGYYASYYITKGLIPYRDFAFVQYPFSAYFYALFFNIFGASIEVARVINIFLQITTLIFCIKIVSILTNKLKTSIIITSLIYGLQLTMLGRGAWLGTKEALACTLIVTFIYFSLTFSKSLSSKIGFTATFLFLSLTKITYIPISFLGLLYLLVQDKNKKPVYISGGVGVAIFIFIVGYFLSFDQFIPLTTWLLPYGKKYNINPDMFWFGLFHVPSILQTIKIHFSQYIILYLFSISFLIYTINQKPFYYRFILFISAIASFVIAYGLFATIRAHPHYLNIIVPILVIMTSSAMVFLLSRYQGVRLVIPFFLLICIYIGFSEWHYSRYTIGTPRYTWFMDKPALCYYNSIADKLTDKMNELGIPPTARGIGMRYSQLLIPTGRALMPGYELVHNFFGTRLPYEDLVHYHLTDPRRYARDIAAGVPDYLFLSDSEITLIDGFLADNNKPTLAQCGYEIAGHFDLNHNLLIKSSNQTN